MKIDGACRPVISECPFKKMTPVFRGFHPEVDGHGDDYDLYQILHLGHFKNKLCIKKIIKFVQVIYPIS